MPKNTEVDQLLTRVPTVEKAVENRRVLRFDLTDAFHLESLT